MCGTYGGTIVDVRARSQAEARYLAARPPLLTCLWRKPVENSGGRRAPDRRGRTSGPLKGRREGVEDL
ncbi:hypothetical protein GCM10011612_04180 [Actinomyces gaoshouyii]|uniref:Uncharacterized protein n=1 Tax=Actinomyces gaoshouyii TaxID=1960083 RepID=A0A8H9LE85_9ACTO|nr:hypothetical protein GCM10011612_04180 [Actinomyces gaoshouyii]